LPQGVMTSAYGLLTNTMEITLEELSMLMMDGDVTSDEAFVRVLAFGQSCKGLLSLSDCYVLTILFSFF